MSSERRAPRSADRGRRRVLQALGIAAVAPAALAQPSELFISRPVTLWVPWPAGGSTDLTMRLLAELAEPQLGNSIVIENRPGAGGTLVMPVLQQSAPDGYTIAQMPQPVLRASHMHKVLWHPIRDITPIIQLSGVTFGVVVAADSPLRTLDDVFAHAKARPGELTISTNGVGTTPHMVMDELMRRRGLRYIHLPYKGTAEQMLGVASGQVKVGINSTGFAPYVDSGQLRLLVTFGEQRTKRWPEVPTLKELGHGIVARSPYGIVGPRGMTAPVVQTLHDAFKVALFHPRHVADLARYDQEPAYLGPEAYGEALREAFAAERRNVERLGLLRRD